MAPAPGKNRRRRRKKRAYRPTGTAARQQTADKPEGEAPQAAPAGETAPQAAPAETPAPGAAPAAQPDTANGETPAAQAAAPIEETAPQEHPAEAAAPEEGTAAPEEPEDAPERPEAGEPAGETGETAETTAAPEDAAAPAEQAEPAHEGQPDTDDGESPAEGPAETESPEPDAAAAPETGQDTAKEEPGGTDEAGPAPGEAPTGEDEGEEDEAPLSEEEEKRISDMTRTVQLSIEQIMAQVGEEAAAPSETDAEETAEAAEEGSPDEPGPAPRRGLPGIAKWLLLVLFFVLVIAGFGVAWLYGNATPDMVPRIEVTFDGQALEPTAYRWKVPVIGNLFKRTYADTLSSAPAALAETVDQVSPDFTVSPSGYRDELTVTDSTGETVYEGDTEDFANFRFTANGSYTAKLVVYCDASRVPGDTSVTGSETWQFTFTLGVRPSIQLSATRAEQGSAVAIRVGETLDGQPPKVTTTLENPGFFRSGGSWVCYIPIPWNAAPGVEELTVEAGGYTETYELEIRSTEWAYKDYSSNSQLTVPYIGAQDLPASVEKLLASSEDTVAWSTGNFVQPFLNSLDVKLAFGTTEYVGRSYSQRGQNTGAGGRTATNTVLNTTRGEPLIAPASGTVLLAQDLGGDLGYTVVIDHGAGVKSLFFGLQGVEVKKGEALKQGQVIATCGRTTVAEMRIGTVPIDPVQVWRGQCDALKYY